MFWSGLVRYGCKNFKNHMKIEDNITLKGILRRYQRKYPRMFTAFKHGFIVSGIYIIGMTLIPGSTLPMQKSIKFYFFRTMRFSSKLYHYNMFSPSAGDYLIKLNQIVLLNMADNLYDVGMIEGYLEEIREVAAEEKKSLKASGYFDLLVYAELMLQKIVRYSNRLLLDEKVNTHLEWVFERSLQHLGSFIVKEKDKKAIEMFYSVLEYLLNFDSKEKTSSYIHQYKEFIKIGKRQTIALEKSFSFLIAKRGLKQQKFLNNLKKIYKQTQSEACKRDILQIFQQLDKIYNSQQIQQKSTDK